MKTKRILVYNSKQFLADIKKDTDVLIYAERTNEYFKTTKKEILNTSMFKEIKYFMTRFVYKNGRLVMVVY